MTTSHVGGCFCGAVRYRLTRDPLFVHGCNCRDCQIQSGGAYVINALIEREAVALLRGAPEPVEMATDSGHPHDVYRCPACGGAVWSDYGRTGYRAFIRVATLDEPERFPPDVYIFTRRRLPWVRYPEGARVFEDYYDVKALWPQDSLDRLRDAKARWAARRE